MTSNQVSFPPSPPNPRGVNSSTERHKRACSLPGCAINDSQPAPYVREAFLLEQKLMVTFTMRGFYRRLVSSLLRTQRCSPTSTRRVPRKMHKYTSGLPPTRPVACAPLSLFTGLRPNPGLRRWMQRWCHRRLPLGSEKSRTGASPPAPEACTGRRCGGSGIVDREVGGLKSRKGGGHVP